MMVRGSEVRRQAGGKITRMEVPGFREAYNRQAEPSSQTGSRSKCGQAEEAGRKQGLFGSRLLTRRQRKLQDEWN